MTGVRQESAFEASMEAGLLGFGWSRVEAGTYDRKLGLFTDELMEFLAQSQPEQWVELCKRHGGEAAALRKVAKRVADEITARGTVDVLRGVVKV